MSVNKVILIGNLGRDPEVHYFENNASVATFPLATTERGYTAKNGTQVPERTDWHNIVMWGGLAEIAHKYLHKGSKVYVEGKIRTRSYTKEGTTETRYVTEVMVDNMEMLTPPAQQAAPAPIPQPAANPAQQSVQTPAKDPYQNDLPF